MVAMMTARSRPIVPTPAVNSKEARVSTEIENQVKAILNEPSETSGKIAKLESLRDDLRGLQRAATESPMTGSDGYEDDLQLIDQMLIKLRDGDIDDADEKNAATL